MADGIHIGQGVKFREHGFGRHKIGVMYGLVTGRDGDMLKVVAVQSTALAQRFFTEVTDPADPCRDNVLLESCPPPFEDVCFGEPGRLGAIRYTGECYAVAKVYDPILVPEVECDLVDGGAEVSEEDMERVFHHDILVQDAKGGLSYNLDGDMGQEATDPEDGLELVSTFGKATGMGELLLAKSDQKRRAGYDASKQPAEDRSVKDIESNVTGMAASAKANLENERGGRDGSEGKDGK